LHVCALLGAWWELGDSLTMRAFASGVLPSPLSVPLFPSPYLRSFQGSGTTALACENLGRRWIGSEISEECAQATIARIREHCGVGA
jgi:hypothetical protein